MMVTRDVVKDLLPVYLAGEASADTRRLVDDFLASDRTLADEVAAARRAELSLPATAAPDQSAEKRTLDATRQWLKHRTSTLAVAIFFTLAPFTATFDGSGFRFVFLRDKPVIALAWWATAAVMWIAHVWIRRRMRVSGL
jgi:anti-sigma factor RsiW